MLHYIKIMLLMAMGLGAMYMTHLLAQDFNIIRGPLAGAAVNALTSASGILNRGKRGVSHTDQLSKANTTTLIIEWKRILSRDPFECLQSLICQIMSGAEAQSKEAELLITFLESNLSIAPSKIARAFSRGLALQGRSDVCYDEYPFCFYSAKTMLRLLEWFSRTT